MTNISITNNPYANIGSGGNELNVPQESVKSIEVKVGSTIQGKVVSISNTGEGMMASIDVGGGVINAKLSEEMGMLREGQILNFLVRGAGDKAVSISPLYENLSPDQSTLKALQAAGLEINNDTVSLVKEMMEAGLPIDKSSLTEMDKNLNLYPQTSISTLVEMKSLNIPINENNIEQFGNYKNYEHQVINDMTEIISELPKVFNELSQNGNDGAAINLYGTVLKMLSESAEAENASLAEQGNITEAERDTAQANVGENVAGSYADSAKVSSETKTSELAESSPELILNNKVGLDGEKQANQVKFSDSFLDNLKNLGVSDKTIEGLLGKNEDSQGNDQVKMLFKELAQSFDNADLSGHVETASWKKLFSSDEYNKILKENIESQWLLKPGDVEKKENIENLYQRLGSHAKALAEAVNNTLGQNSTLGQAANNLNNNIDFMNQLNHMFQYVQLPLQMAGKNVHGDLYVYQNKHKKMSEDGSVSAVLHLDMDNLGPVDVYVKLKDTKVTTNFYVMDEDVIELINDNIHLLHERLEKRGYSMQVNCKLHTDTDSEDPAVDKMLEVSKTPLLSTASFDARA